MATDDSASRSAVIDAVGCDHDVSCEPVTAYMRAFPHQLWPTLTQCTSHGPSPHGAAWVMLTMSADQDDGRIAELSGEAQGCGNLRQVLILAPRSPLLTIGAGLLMVQYGPTARTLAPAGAGPPHQQHPCTRRLRGGEHECFGLRLKIKAFEAVGRPPAPVLDEDPDTPCDAVPAIESPRIRALSEQKKRSVAATGRSHCSTGTRTPARNSLSTSSTPRSRRGVNLAVEQARYRRQIGLWEVEPTHARGQARALQPCFQCIPKPHQRLGAEAVDGRELGQRTQRCRASLSSPGAVEKGSWYQPQRRRRRDVHGRRRSPHRVRRRPMARNGASRDRRPALQARPARGVRPAHSGSSCGLPA